jgi:hypothetical protein
MLRWTDEDVTTPSASLTTTSSSRSRAASGVHDPDSSPNTCSLTYGSGDLYDPELGRPIAATLEQCAELLGVDLATVREVAANIVPYVRSDGTNVWSLMLLERQLRPEAFGRRRGGYLDRRRTPPTR